MKDLTIFDYEGNEVRTIIGEDGEPWWVAKDVCDILELGHITQALKGLEEEDLTVTKLQSGGQIREMKIINEPGLYTLILRSNKPEAKKFRKWITKEVLPSIRKTGSYSTKPLSMSEQILMQAQMLVALEKEQIETRREQEKLKADQLKISHEVDAIKHKIKDDPGYFAITGYANIYDVSIDAEMAKYLGKSASSLSRERGVHISRVKHGRWGYVNAYHELILKDVFDEFFEGVV